MQVPRPAIIRNGDELMIGRVRAIVLAGDWHRSQIAAADAIEADEEREGLWRIYYRGNHIGYVDDEILARNADLVAQKQWKLNRDPEIEGHYSPRELFFMLVGAIILGVLATLAVNR